MKRNCIKIAEQENRFIYIDSDNANEIFEIFEKDSKLKEKFDHRIEQLKRGITNRNSYEKLTGYQNLWEIRLFKNSKGRNHRIYCKQINTEERIIHIIIIKIFLQKKSNHIPKKVKKQLKIIDKYDYSLQQ